MTYTCSECDAQYTDDIPATGEHTYANACDVDCDVCGATREVGDHVYDNDQDPTCNACGHIREIQPPAVENALGDVDGDGKINNMDLVTAIRYLNGVDVQIDLKAADVCADGKFDVKDVLRLQQYLNGWDVELGAA
jgi:hypothetical protein